MNYSNEGSLKAEWGIATIDGILGVPPDAARLEKAAKAATDEINGYLFSGGYVAPFLFTAFGGDPPVDGTAPLIDGKLQAVSDALTIDYLANRDDFNRKPFDEAAAESREWLEKVRMGDIRLTILGVTGPTGSGNVRVIARPQIFDRYMLRERDVFGPNRG